MTYYMWCIWTICGMQENLTDEQLSNLIDSIDKRMIHDPLMRDSCGRTVPMITLLRVTTKQILHLLPHHWSHDPALTSSKGNTVAMMAALREDITFI